MGKEDCTISINYFNFLEESLLITNISAYAFNITHTTQEDGLPDPPVFKYVTNYITPWELKICQYSQSSQTV
jgi:hypothetical protein